MTAGPRSPAVARIVSLDACRGLVMLLLLAEVLRLCQVSEAVPGSSLLAFLCRQQTHAAWVGCTLHDLIQPGFCFLVGAALPFSLARRRDRGESLPGMYRHAAFRSALLILLGVGVVSLHARQWVWSFVDTLAQIGLAYAVLFPLALRPAREQWGVLAVILIGYWMLFAVWPLPGPGFDYARVGVSREWLEAHGLSGFAAHWQKNSHVAWAFDTWFLNLFPQHLPFVYQPMGLATLNFIPTVGTMLLGLRAGELLRGEGSCYGKVAVLVVASIVGWVAAWVLGALGVCPVVKRIWTPSWVLFSGAWCALLLGAFHGIAEGPLGKRLLFPLVVVGANSTLAYCGFHLYTSLAYHGLARLVGHRPFRVLGEAYEPLVYGVATLVGAWLVFYGLYRKRWFVRL